MSRRNVIIIGASAAAGVIVIVVLVIVLWGGDIIDPPAGFLRMEDPYYYLFKAVSPDGCVFTLKERDNEGESDLGDWKKAVRNQLERGKGYQFVSEGKLTTAAGSPGWEMVFGSKMRGVDYVYYVAVARWDHSFWGMHRLYVVEAAGEKKYMDRDLDSIRKAAASLRY
jgi:hypothetical protein